MTSEVQLSPLASVPEDTLGLIFSSDPRELTSADYSTLVLELRRRRSVHLAEEAAKAAKGKKAKEPKPIISAPEAAKLNKPTAELTLDDLLSE